MICGYFSLFKTVIQHYKLRKMNWAFYHPIFYYFFYQIYLFKRNYSALSIEKQVYFLQKRPKQIQNLQISKLRHIQQLYQFQAYFLTQILTLSYRLISSSYNIIKARKVDKMGSFNIICSIGMIFFWIKFYIIIGLSYVYYFVKYFVEKLLYGNSKTIICPYKNTHQHVFLTIQQLIAFDGYSIEDYEFETLDQAYVSFWRVRSKDPNLQRKPYPVLLLHGLLDCSVSWFLHADKTKCLPYMLANQGYDVWVGNNRGTKHSLKNSDMPNYWDYCFDHFVLYDQPTMINSILSQTGKQKLIYIGHSQGSTQFIVSTGLNDFNNKIACFIGMGTVISLENVKDHAVLKYLSKFKGVEILKFLGFKTVLSLPKWVTKFTGILIYNIDFCLKFFFGIVNLLCGKPVQNKIDLQRLGVIISHQPGGTSIPTVQQWIQFHKNGKMARFDYGSKKNKILYGSESAPQYTFQHLKQYKFNSYIFKGKMDAVVSDKDFQKLTNFMNKDKFQTLQLHDYAHLDYVWGKDAHYDIYDKIIDILDREEKF